MRRPNLFDTTAEFYDLDTQYYSKQDLSFYRSLLAGHPIPTVASSRSAVERRTRIARDEIASRPVPPKRKVLELACGTGRVSIPLAKDGAEVVGVDLSEAMLREFRQKLSKETREVQRRIRIERASMADFTVEGPFDLIIIPFRGFQALTDPSEVGRCLSAVGRRLSPGGIFVIDVFYVSRRLGKEWIHGEQEDWSRSDPRTGLRIKRSRSNPRIDVEGQIIFPEIIYDVRDASGKERRLVDKLALKYYFQWQLEVLLASHGFRILRELGSYSGDPVGRGPELICICERA
jgi:SAM-dependent methyltransferase